MAWPGSSADEHQKKLLPTHHRQRTGPLQHDTKERTNEANIVHTGMCKPLVSVYCVSPSVPQSTEDVSLFQSTGAEPGALA